MSLNHFVGLWRTKCNIIWRVLNIYDYIIIKKMYVRCIYLMPWNFVCNHRVSWSSYKTTIIWQLTKLNESKIKKIYSKTIGILEESLCVCVCVCVCKRMWVCVVECYCVCMCAWYIVLVYGKVHEQRVIFTGG